MYTYTINYEEDLNPYYFPSLTPANAIYPHLSTSAKNIYLSPHSPYLLSPTITIEKKKSDDDKDKDKKNIKIDLPLLSPIFQSYVPVTNSYQNVNNDPDLIRSVSKYFFESTMNRWLYSDFQELLRYLVIKNKKVNIVGNRDDLMKNKLDNNMDDMRTKIKFISEYVMTKYDMKSFLKRLALETGLDLWKFKKYKSKIKKSIYRKIKKKLEKLSFNSKL